MADNYLWDKQSPNPSQDVENPPVPNDNIASVVNSSSISTGSTQHERRSLAISKTMKLGFVFVALSVAVVLGVTLTLERKSSLGGATSETVSASAIAASSPTGESGIENESSNQADNTHTTLSLIETKPDDLHSMKTEYYTSLGPLEARVKMVSPSIVNGYESCSDLEGDITEALKLYMNKFIMNEAVSGEMNANCDPENENWWWDLYGYSNYYYDEVNYTCSPASNDTTTSCVTENTEVPWVVTWHVADHAEGKLFYNETEARTEYESIDSQWAKRLYDPSKNIVDEQGSMPESMWCQLETWAYNAQCNGEAPSALKKRKSIAKQSRSGTRSASTDSSTGHRNRGSKQGDKSGDSHGLNNQNDSANENDRVVSDGTYIFAAYGDVLYTWAANDMTDGVSITKMPSNETACDWNVTEPCIETTKPVIRALFLGNSRLSVIMSQSSWFYPTQNKTQPIITDFDTKTSVLVFDISEVSLGYPLEQLGYTELTGSFSSGRSIGDKTIITTESYIDTWLLTQDLSRSESQYCGLDTQSYKELAAEKAMANVQSLAKQMVADLELVNDCSRIFQVSMLQTSSDESNTSMDDVTKANMLGTFVQVSTFDMASDLGEGGEISIAVAGAFTPGGVWPVYLSDDFLAVPSNIYDYNSTSQTDLYETFILGFDLSTEAGAAPFCYGQVPGNVDNNYRMDMWDGHLRVATTNYVYSNSGNLTFTFVPKIYVLEIPSVQGGSREMSLVGEADISGGGISGTRFVGDKAYVFTSDWTGYNGEFLSIDLSDQLNPQVVGNLATNGTLSYLQEITIDNITYILGIGYEMDEVFWESYMKLSLFDVSTPSSVKLATSFKGPAGYSSDAVGDFLAVRYLPESTRLIIPVSRSDGMLNYSDGFTVFDISKDSFTPALNVTHSTSASFCWYEASIPARSFVFQSELTTVKGHTAISTDIQSGSLISELDLDIGLNYSFCEPWYYYNNNQNNYGYDYDDAVEGTLNGTESCELPNSIQADIVQICTETEFASLSWVFNLTSASYCNNGKFFAESMGNVSSANECAQKCVEKHNRQDASGDSVMGLQYECDGNCVW
eukprot:CCRYP_019470-RA/>CCRYP_019470-RA protein AED:0.07 eAED:0.07 QI:559/1/1/1/1/1/3/377/1074